MNIIGDILCTNFCDDQVVVEREGGGDRGGGAGVLQVTGGMLMDERRVLHALGRITTSTNEARASKETGR